MCLAVPGKIVSINDSNPDLKMGKVDFGGVAKDICLEWVPDAKIGNYVLAHVGFALSIVDEKEALETIRVVQEMGDLIDEHDAIHEPDSQNSDQQNLITE